MITVVDCFIFLLLEAWSIRYLEGAFAFLVLMMAVTFAIVFFHDRPPAVREAGLLQNCGLRTS